MTSPEESLLLPVSSFASWRIAAAAIAGANHRNLGIACQDHFQITTALALNGEPLLLLVLADGAGSAEQGRTGAILACGFLAERITEDLAQRSSAAGLDRARVGLWLAELREHLSEVAEAAGHRLRDYATTVALALVGAIAPEVGGLILQVGDSAAVYRGSGDWQIAAWPQRGEFANSTFFVTDDELLQNFELVPIAETVREIALFSDGIERLVLTHHGQSIYQPFFDLIFQPLRQQAGYGIDSRLSESLARYLQSPTIVSRCDDDCSLILATSLPHSKPGES
ncbi:MAG: PP2C family serine/threonine-protein phosphatase [Alphaproteobacteria bacterium]|nr:PP2C family serine/threonine-protein phosphatase [Alphaproteobacteria bacterium]